MPSLSEARNFAGIVSRFFASRVWSKVPRKAIGHLAPRVARKWTRTEGEEWEEPLHPGPHAALVPHYPPLSNSTCTSSPTSVVHLTSAAPRLPWSSAFAWWDAVG